MNWSRALDILKKALVVFPVVVKVIGEIDTEVKKAQAVDSAGGKSLTAVEIAGIVATSLGKVTASIIDVFASDAKKA